MTLARKPMRRTRRPSASAAEKRHLEAVAAVPCVLCTALGVPPAPTTVHHIRSGQGASQRASHWLTVALCHSCHQGDRGVHGDQSFLRQAKVTELDLLAATYEAIERRRAA